ncbi:MAG TPA: serine hydrolase [Puia sp.]|nr:serine hydrolase [Puia sp.]
MKHFLISPLILLQVFTSYDSNAQVLTDRGDSARLLTEIMQRYPEYFSRFMKDQDSFKIQVIYTKIDRDSHNQPIFNNYYYKVDSFLYFYPASTVKLPIALLALQKVNELRLPGLDKYSTIITECDSAGQTAVYNDPTTQDGRPSVSSYVKKIFLVSDNDAFNRLYEFLGQEYINRRLQQMGYTDVQILHRLSLSLTSSQNRNTNPISFFGPTGNLLYRQPGIVSKMTFQKRHDFIGAGYIDISDHLINRPMDFSEKNRIQLKDLHNILKSIIFPNSVPTNQRFNLLDEDYAFLYQYMSEFPGESIFPRYDSLEYWNTFGKLLFWGSDKATKPGHIRIFNKEGDAYGFLTDVSYLVDFEKKIEFFLSATIYCNNDGILNDDKYDYQTIGLPFLKHLGQVIYEYELKRPRSNQPDLRPFMMTYVK